MAANRLREAWQAYMLTPMIDEKKVRNLDEFLRNYHAEGIAASEELIFSDMNSVGNILARAFLADVQQCCSQSEADDDDSSSLINYLLKERGWLILETLVHIGVKSLSCQNELSLLLINLLPIVLKFPSTTSHTADQWSERVMSLESYFTSRLTAFESRLLSGTSSVPRLTASKRGRYTRSQTGQQQQQQQQQQQHTDSSASSDDELTVPVKHSDNANTFLRSHFRSSDHNAVAVSPFDFSILVIELIRVLCNSDISGQLASTVCPDLLNVLINAQSNWCLQEFICFQRILVRCLVTIAHSASERSNASKLDTYKFFVKSVLKLCEKCLSMTGSTEMLTLLLDLLENILVLIRQSLSSLMNPVALEENMKLFLVFTGSDGHKMVKEALLRAEKRLPFRSLSVSYARVVMAMKRLRMDYVHFLRGRKKRIKDPGQLHHHHNILGLARCQYDTGVVTSSVDGQTPRDRLCVVAGWSEFLLEVFAESKSRWLSEAVLSAVDMCGVCCCLPPEVVLDRLISRLDTRGSHLARKVLKVTVKLLLDQCGAGAQVSDKNCMFCSDFDLKPSKRLHIWKDEHFVATNGAYSRIDANFDTTKNRPWKAVAVFENVVRKCNQNMAPIVIKSLLRLVNNGTETMKLELFNYVFMPLVFDVEVSNAEYDSKGGNAEVRKCKTSIALKLLCLSALPNLLQCKLARQQFYQWGHLKRLMELVNENALRRSVMKILEVLIILNDGEVMKSWKNYSLNNVSLQRRPSQWYDQDIVFQAGEACFQTICDAASDLFLSTLLVLDDDGVDAFLAEIEANTFDDGIHHQKHDAALARTVDETGVKMPRECDFFMWKSCENLLTHSPTFREKFSLKKGFKHANQVLHWCIQRLGEIDAELSTNDKRVCERAQDTFNSLLVLLESLIIISLRCTAVTGMSNTQHLTTEKLILYLHTQLSSSIRSNHYAVSCLCSRLFTCMTSQSTLDELLKSNSGVFMHVAEAGMGYDSDSSDDEGTDEDNGDDVKDESHTLLLGYDADIEVDEAESGFSIRTIDSQSDVNQATKWIVHPPVCVVLLKLLSVYQTDVLYDAMLSGILEKIVDLLRDNQLNAVALYEQNAVSVILTEFSDVISSVKYENTRNQVLLLEIFSLLADTTLSATELSLFLRILERKECALGSVQQCLLNLTNNTRTQATYIVCFPMLFHEPQRRRASVRMSGSMSPNGHSVDTFCLISKADAANTRRQPDISDVTSAAFKHGALQLGVGECLRWPAEKGASLSLWLRIEAKSKGRTAGSWMKRKLGSEVDVRRQPFASRRESNVTRGNVAGVPDKCLLLVAIGSPGFLFEVWIQPFSGSLHIRLTSCHVEDEVLAECVLTSVVRAGCWEHLAISVRHCPTDHHCACLVTVHINGCRQRQVSLEFSNLGQFRTLNDVKVLLGHSVMRTEEWTSAHLQLSNFMLFKDAVIRTDEAFHLYSLGSDCATISQCEAADLTPVYKFWIDAELLTQADLNHDVLTCNQSLDITHLRERLALTYTPFSPGTYNLYRPARTVTGDQPRISNLLKKPRLPSFNPFTQQSELMPVESLGPVLARGHRGLATALDEIGGIGVVLFLYARIVEKSSSSAIQAQALKVLLSLVQHNQNFARNFLDIDGYSLLQKVMLAPRCIIDGHTLKILMDTCLSESSITLHPVTAVPELIINTTAIVQDTRIITDLLLAWKVWDRASPELWHTGLACLEQTIGEVHQHRDFNLKQLHSVSLVNKLLQIYQERIQECYPSLAPTIGGSVVKLIRSLLGNPPDINHLVSICDFLLLVHPAASTYVCHYTDAFYFNTTWSRVSDQEPELRSKIRRLSVSSMNIADMRKAGKGKLTNVTSPSLSEPTLRRSRSSTDMRPATSGSDPNIVIVDDHFRMTSSDDLTTESQKNNFKLSHLRGRATSDTNVRQERTSTESSCADNDTMDDTAADERDSHDDDDVQVRDPASTRSQTPEDGEDILTTITDDDSSPLIISAPLSIRSEDWEMYPDVSSMKSLPIKVQQSVDAAHYSVGDDVDEHERGLVHLTKGLLQLLSGVVTTLADTAVKKIIGVVLKPEILLILAHHNSCDIRTSVVQLLDRVLQRMDTSHLTAFADSQGYFLLASQLHQHPVNRALVEACFSLFLCKQHGLEEDIEAGAVLNLSTVQQRAIVVPLSVLTKTVHDRTICHNTLCLLMQVFESCPTFTHVMFECGLLEVLCNTILAINKAQIYQSSSPVQENLDLLIEDVEHFFSLMAVDSFTRGGLHHAQQYEDIIQALSSLEMAEKKKYKTHGHATLPMSNIRGIQCQVLQALVNYVCTRTNQPDQKYLTQRRTTYFPPVSAARDLEETITAVKPSVMIAMVSSEADMASTSTSVEDINYLLMQVPIRDRSLSLDVTRRRSSLLDVNLLEQMRHSAVKRKEYKLTQGDLMIRVKNLIVNCVDLMVFSEPIALAAGSRTVELGEPDHNLPFHLQFQRFLLEFLMKAILDGLEKTKTAWKALMWQVKDVIRVQFTRLFVHMLSAGSLMCQRLFTIHMLMHEPRYKEIIKLAFKPNQTRSHKAVTYLHNLVMNDMPVVSKMQRIYTETLMTAFKQAGLHHLTLTEPLKFEHRQSLEEDMDMWLVEHHKYRQVWLKQLATSLQRISHKMDLIGQRVSAGAMETTQIVVNIQNLERKKFIEHIKMRMTYSLQVKKSWQKLIQQLTHERAVWYCEESYPVSWQLDPTEGPMRVRKRLQRCHIAIPARFLMENHRRKLDGEKLTPPLSYLFDDEQQSSDSAALIYRLHTNEKITKTWRSVNVTPSLETCGELLIGENIIYFVADVAILDADYTQVLLGNNDQLSMMLPLEEVKEIYKRRYELKNTALEIFLTNGKTSLLTFESVRERDRAYEQLMTMNLPNLIKAENLTAILQLWIDGQITNFEYLTHLNQLAGRTFNDLMQYPVFPFVLADYTSDILNLTEPKSFRNLTRPIAVQHENKEKKFIENYEWLKKEYEGNSTRQEEDEFAHFYLEPYHYGSHYSNSGTVLHFMVRMPPYTKMFLQYQDHNFDVPDRTFHSMATTWRLSSAESTTDVKELIPEFFCLPEFLMNNESFDFGKRQTGETVDDVILPSWCHNNARIFVLIHRQALESYYLSRNLHHWIDLVFGYKQTGKAAIDAVNVFHPATYFGVDVESIADPLKRRAVETMIRTYGQTPKQLFKNAHPPRSVAAENEDVMTSHYMQDRHVHGQSVAYTYKPTPFKTVRGLKWGNYVGSPDCNAPVETWKQVHGSEISSLYALPTGEVFGLGPYSCLLVQYTKERGVTSMTTVDCVWAGVISWAHADGILRIKNRHDAPAVNFIHRSTAEEVTCCASVPDCKLLFIATTSGVVNVYNTTNNNSKQCDLQVTGFRQCLYGHRGRVTCLSVSNPYSILVSAGEDGTCIIWDLNRLCYVRSLSVCDAGSTVTAVAISDTLGDIASVINSNSGSTLHLYTINGQHIGHVTSQETIHCVAYSTAPEGRSVNVIAGGLNNGCVRLWSCWDLQFVRDIVIGTVPKSVISLTYSHDCQRLFVSLRDGTVVQYEKQGQKSKVKFTPIL